MCARCMPGWSDPQRVMVDEAIKYLAKNLERNEKS